VNTTIPDLADGIMVDDQLYVMGGATVKSTYEIDVTKR